MWAGEWPNVVNLERVHTVRIVVVGAPGTGKTTLCQAICGDADALGKSMAGPPLRWWAAWELS